MVIGVTQRNMCFVVRVCLYFADVFRWNLMDRFGACAAGSLCNMFLCDMLLDIDIDAMDKRSTQMLYLWVIEWKVLRKRAPKCCYMLTSKKC